jgi:hypothetical protein
MMAEAYTPGNGPGGQAPPPPRRRPAPRRRQAATAELNVLRQQIALPALPGKPLLPSQKRLMKALQQRGEGPTGHYAPPPVTGEPVPQRIEQFRGSPPHTAYESGAVGDVGARPRREYRQGDTMSQALRASQFVQWQLAQEKARMLDELQDGTEALREALQGQAQARGMAPAGLSSSALAPARSPSRSPYRGPIRPVTGDTPPVRHAPASPGRF